MDPHTLSKAIPLLSALAAVALGVLAIYIIWGPSIFKGHEPKPNNNPNLDHLLPTDLGSDYSRCDSAENKTKVCQKIGHKGRSIDGYLSKQYFHVMSPPYHEKVIAMRQLTLVHINDKRYPLPGMVLLRVYKDWALYEIRFAIKLETFMELYFRIFKHCKECISLERTLKNNQK